MTMVKGGVAYNVIPAEMDVSFDLRIPPTVDLQVSRRAAEVTGGLPVNPHSLLHSSDPPPGVWKADQRVVQRSRGGRHLPICSGVWTRRRCSKPRSSLVLRLNELPSVAETHEPEYDLDGGERPLVGGLQWSLQRDVRMTSQTLSSTLCFMCWLDFPVVAFTRTVSLKNDCWQSASVWFWCY